MEPTPKRQALEQERTLAEIEQDATDLLLNHPFTESIVITLEELLWLRRNYYGSIDEALEQERTLAEIGQDAEVLRIRGVLIKWF